MIKYVAFLRGINVGGKNRISMPQLKREFEELKFHEVLTYINSGNVIFSSDIADINAIKNSIEMMINIKFGFNIPIFIISIEKLGMILEKAPEWWDSGSKDIYDNTIFIIPPTTYEEVFFEIGEAKQEYEKIDHYSNVIYWSFELKSYSKTNWKKTANSKINDMVTIRTANTVKKLLELSK